MVLNQEHYRTLELTVKRICQSRERARHAGAEEFFVHAKITSWSTYPYGEIKAYQYLNLNLPVYSSRPI